MNRFLNPAIAVLVLSAWAFFPSCTSDVGPDTYVQQEAANLQKRTVPTDARLLTQRPPTVQRWVASADWEFETNYSPDAYLRWVTGKLRPDFQVHEGPNSPTRFSKYARGEIEALSIETTPSSGMLQVKVVLEIYPD